MRVISGKYKGRNLKGFNIVGTRPTMDRVKESVFAMISNKLKDATILDLFAGSGNLGIESLSNGSTCAYFVDNNKTAIKTIRENIENLHVSEEVYTYQMDYKEALNYFSDNHTKFDIIFLDPPYNAKILSTVLKEIKKCNILKENGIIILEYENDVIDFEGYQLAKLKKYGNKKIMILHNE